MEGALGAPGAPAGGRGSRPAGAVALAALSSLALFVAATFQAASQRPSVLVRARAPRPARASRPPRVPPRSARGSSSPAGARPVPSDPRVGNRIDATTRNSPARGGVLTRGRSRSRRAEPPRARASISPLPSPDPRPMFPAVLRVPPSLRRRARGERGAAPRRRPVRILVDPDASRCVAPRVHPHHRRLARAGRRPGVLRELRSDLALSAPRRAPRAAMVGLRALLGRRRRRVCRVHAVSRPPLRRRRPPVRAQENRREARGGLRGPPRGRGGRGRGGGARAHIFRDARGRTREGGPIGRALRRFAPDVAGDARVRARRRRLRAVPPRASVRRLLRVLRARSRPGDARRAYAPADAPEAQRSGPKARRRRRRRVGRLGFARRTQSPARRLFVSPPRGERAGVRGVRRVALRPRVRVPAPGTRGERGRGQGGVARTLRVRERRPGGGARGRRVARENENRRRARVGAARRARRSVLLPVRDRGGERGRGGKRPSGRRRSEKRRSGRLSARRCVRRCIRRSDSPVRAAPGRVRVVG